jgi:hypothetical protein
MKKAHVLKGMLVMVSTMLVSVSIWAVYAVMIR